MQFLPYLTDEKCIERAIQKVGKFDFYTWGQDTQGLSVEKGHLQQDPAVHLNDIIIDAIDDKKGHEISTLDLRKISDSVADFFIICHGESTTQVKAIAENIDRMVKEVQGEAPWHKEGMQNLEWVLLDYFDVVVHVFLKEKRSLYQLEELWSDAVITRHNAMKDEVTE